MPGHSCRGGMLPRMCTGRPAGPGIEGGAVRDKAAGALCCLRAATESVGSVRWPGWDPGGSRYAAGAQCGGLQVLCRTGREALLIILSSCAALVPPGHPEARGCVGTVWFAGECPRRGRSRHPSSPPSPPPVNRVPQQMSVLSGL